MSLSPEQIILESWSTIAAAASAAVFITPLIFPSMRKQIFVNLISYAALCTFMTSLGTWLGFPDDGSTACSAQAFIISFFSKASWFWLTIISLELFSIFVYEKFFFTQPSLYMNLAVWPLTLFLTLIPLATSKFGRTSDDKSDGWCFLSGDDTDSDITLWSIISIYIPFFVCLVLMVFFAIFVRLQAFSTNKDRIYVWDPIFKIINSMFLYPIFFITWFPFVILSIVDGYSGYSDSGASKVAVDFGNILSTQLGSFVFLIFFWTSAEARFRWSWLLASPCFGSPKYNPYDDANSATPTADLSRPLIDTEEGDRLSSHDSDLYKDNWRGNRASRITTVQNRFPLLYEFFGRFMTDTEIQYEIKDAASPVKIKPSATRFDK